MGENAAVRDRPADERAGGGAPEDPTDLGRRSWLRTLKRTAVGFQRDHLTDWAAALTYYGVLAIFPALLALVSVLGVIGTSATQPLIDNLGTLAPGPARDILMSALRNLEKGQGAAGVLFVGSLAVGLWSASGYVSAFMRASNAIYEVGEGRPIWRTVPTRLLTTIVLLVLFALVAVAVAITGPLAKQLGNVVGVGSAAVAVWGIAKWPVILLGVMTMLAILYWAAPNVKHPKLRWVSPGSVLALVMWIAASAVFTFYVANFGSYNKTYGALGGVIVFLVWLWISNIAVLVGAEFDAELERSRAIEGGGREDQEPFVELRDTRKLKHDGAG